MSMLMRINKMVVDSFMNFELDSCAVTRTVGARATCTTSRRSPIHPPRRNTLSLITIVHQFFSIDPIRASTFTSPLSSITDMCCLSLRYAAKRSEVRNGLHLTFSSGTCRSSTTGSGRLSCFQPPAFHIVILARSTLHHGCEHVSCSILSSCVLCTR